MSVPSKTVTSLGPWSSSAGMPVTLSVPESVSLPVSVAATQVYTPENAINISYYKGSFIKAIFDFGKKLH